MNIFFIFLCIFKVKYKLFNIFVNCFLIKFIISKSKTRKSFQFDDILGYFEIEAQ
jgi:hypothetical protein